MLLESTELVCWCATTPEPSAQGWINLPPPVQVRLLLHLLFTVSSKFKQIRKIFFCSLCWDVGGVLTKHLSLWLSSKVSPFVRPVYQYALFCLLQLVKAYPLLSSLYVWYLRDTLNNFCSKQK